MSVGKGSVLFGVAAGLLAIILQLIVWQCRSFEAVNGSGQWGPAARTICVDSDSDFGLCNLL